MNKHHPQKLTSPKLYSPNWLSLTSNNDSSHQKLWGEKVEEGKHVQEQKQIDRILFGIVKERLFGQLLGQDTRISNEGYYALGKIGREGVNPVLVRGRRKIAPLVGQPSYDIVVRDRFRSQTIDAGSASRGSRSLQHGNSNLDSSGTPKPSRQLNPLTKTKRLFFPKQISSQKLLDLPTHFRDLTNNQSAMLYDLKLTKQMLIKYNKSKQIVSPYCVEKLLYFFNFMGPYGIKQYGTWLESVFNCTMGESSFAIFQVLDQSRNGFLTITDIFQALQDFPMTSSSQIQKQIYQLMQRIKATRETLTQPQPESPNSPNLNKLSVQQIIVRNHNLKLEQMRELVKQVSKQLVTAQTFKSTTYHKSMYALEHTAATREKNSQLESSEESNMRGFQRTKKAKSELEEGLRFGEYKAMFQARRSEIFMLFGRLLLGSDANVLE